MRGAPATKVIDGHWGFGSHVNAKAMALTFEKAKTTNAAACTAFRQGHVDRLAAYPMMAMREGIIGLAAADSGRSPKHVAPFGGRGPRLGTNPISIAVPSALEGPVYLDTASSAVAAGKVALSIGTEQIAKGWRVLVGFFVGGSLNQRYAPPSWVKPVCQSSNMDSLGGTRMEPQHGLRRTGMNFRGASCLHKSSTSDLSRCKAIHEATLLAEMGPTITRVVCWKHALLWHQKPRRAIPGAPASVKIDVGTRWPAIGVVATARSRI